MASDALTTGISLDFIALQSELIHTAADLSRLTTLASASGEDAEAAKAADRLNHLASGTFVVAVIGQFKRGKSTLANALLGAEIMPADVEPATATINRVVYGRVPRATMCMRGGGTQPVPIDSLARYVTKLSEESSAAAAAIDEALIEFPARMCLNNVQLLDTPGLDDVDTSMTARTTSVLSRIDAALLVTSALAPLESTEIDILRDLMQHVDVTRIFIVLNQADLLEPLHRPRILEAAAKRAAKALGRPGEHIFLVSAREALAAKLAKDEPRFAASGFQALEDALEQFLVRDSGLARVQAANETLERLALAQDERAQAKLAQLQLKDAESQARLAELEAGLDSIVQRIAQWPERAEGLCAAQMSEVDAQAHDLQKSITEQALEALGSVVFTSVDVEDNDRRHAKVRTAVNSEVYPAFIQFVDTDAEDLRELLRELTEDLAKLSDEWDAALQRGIVNDLSARVIESIRDGVVSEMALKIDEGLERYLVARKHFIAGYEAKCDLLLLEAFVRRFVKTWRDEMVGRLPGAYRDHLPNVVGHAFSASLRSTLRQQSVKEVVAALLIHLQTLADRSNRSLDERKWILRLERERVDKDRVRAEERVLAVLSGAREIAERAGDRRIALRRIVNDRSHLGT
jgi:ribosome biogenesis GTPase A